METRTTEDQQLQPLQQIVELQRDFTALSKDHFTTSRAGPLESLQVDVWINRTSSTEERAKNGMLSRGKQTIIQPYRSRNA